jgi:hypothetical protein
MSSMYKFGQSLGYKVNNLVSPDTNNSSNKRLKRNRDLISPDEMKNVFEKSWDSVPLNDTSDASNEYISMQVEEEKRKDKNRKDKMANVFKKSWDPYPLNDDFEASDELILMGREEEMRKKQEMENQEMENPEDTEYDFPIINSNEELEMDLARLPKIGKGKSKNSRKIKKTKKSRKIKKTKKSRKQNKSRKSRKSRKSNKKK